jgi:hypothetical protein
VVVVDPVLSGVWDRVGLLWLVSLQALARLFIFLRLCDRGMDLENCTEVGLGH